MYSIEYKTKAIKITLAANRQPSHNVKEVHWPSYIAGQKFNSQLNSNTKYEEQETLCEQYIYQTINEKQENHIVANLSNHINQE